MEAKLPRVTIKYEYTRILDDSDIGTVTTILLRATHLLTGPG